MAGTVAAHLFRNGYDDLSRNAQLLAEAAAAEIGRSPRTTVERSIAFNETVRSRSNIRHCRWRSFLLPPTPQRRCRVVPGNI